MSHPSLDIVMLGLSITSSWGNGHATTYRALVRELAARGHRILFLERDQPWYAENRDLPHPPWCRTEIYAAVSELKARFAAKVRNADVVVVGSYVPEGADAGEWVTHTAKGLTVFYDIDTPVTLANLARARCEYLRPDLIPRYHLYLSFTGGPTLDYLEQHYDSPCARPLYCSVDSTLYHPEPAGTKWDLGYLGTYSADRQPPLERLMLAAARRWSAGRMVVAGPMYPPEFHWPPNVERIIHLEPSQHRSFYNAQRFTLNITRAAMIAAGWSPSVRLFEAAACGTPIISDAWEGLESFFAPGDEILLTHSPQETLAFLQELPEPERLRIAERARARILANHTAAHRAAEFEHYVRAVTAGRET